MNQQPQSTVFTPHATGIPGLIIFDVTSMGDERGYFQEKYHKEKLVAAGMPESFEAVQHNVTYSKAKGVTRGIHGEPWSKYVSVVTGRVFVAYVDMRDGPTYGKVATAEITPEKAVFVPKGVAASYQTLEADTYYVYSMSSHRTPELMEQGRYLNPADPALGIDWPIPLDQAVLSDKDKNLPFLKDVTPMEG